MELLGQRNALWQDKMQDDWPHKVVYRLQVHADIAYKLRKNTEQEVYVKTEEAACILWNGEEEDNLRRKQYNEVEQGIINISRSQALVYYTSSQVLTAELISVMNISADCYYEYFRRIAITTARMSA